MQKQIDALKEKMKDNTIKITDATKGIADIRLTTRKINRIVKSFEEDAALASFIPAKIAIDDVAMTLKSAIASTESGIKEMKAQNNKINKALKTLEDLNII